MKRTMHSRRLRVTPLLLVTFAISVCHVEPLRADNNFNYNAQRRTINAGNLLIDSTGVDSLTGLPVANGPANTEPYVFYLLNNRTDVLPSGWHIVNPLAPKYATTAIINRWNARTPGQGPGTSGYTYWSNKGGNVFSLGQPIDETMAPYWEVTLSQTSLRDLLKFDILYFKFWGNIPLKAADKEKLRRYVDAGGKLWVELSGNPPSFYLGSDGLFFASTKVGFGSGMSLAADLQDPLVTMPYPLTKGDILALGDQDTNPSSSPYISQPNAINPVLSMSSPLLPAVDAFPGSAGTAVVAVNQFGAGAVFVDSVGIADGINDGNRNGTTMGLWAAGGHNAGATCIDTSVSPAVNVDKFQSRTADLKLLVNMMAWSGGQRYANHNGHQNNADPDPRGASVAPAWRAPFVSPVSTSSSSIPLPGAAIYRGSVTFAGKVYTGGIAFVRDAKGALDAFDLSPPASRGTISSGTWSDLAPIWSDSGAGTSSSAPMIAMVPTNGSPGSPYLPCVFIELDSGEVDAYDISNLGAGKIALVNSGIGGSLYSAVALPQAAPSPTYYDGRIYAGQPDGNLYICDLSNGVASGAAFIVRPSATTGLSPQEYVMSSPMVGIVTDVDPGDPNAIPASDIQVFVATNKMIYSLFIGARNELTIGSSTIHNPKVGGLNLIVVKVDSTPNWATYFLDSASYPSVLSSTGGAVTLNTAVPNNFTTLNPIETLYADYNSDLSSVSGTNGGLSRTTFGGSSFTVTPALDGARISEPVMDRSGNIFYTSSYPGQSGGASAPGSSTLVCALDSPNFNDRAMNWRFRIPTTTDGSVIDADGVNYDQLQGYNFVGPPVVDDRGFVFALMSNGTATTPPTFARIICIDSHRGVSLDLPNPVNPGQPVAAPAEFPYVTVSQPLASNANIDEFGQFPNPIGPNQMKASKSGHVDLVNFSQPGSQLYPNLCEPEPVNAQYQFNDGLNGTAPQPSNPNMIPLHTNVVWFTDAIPVNGSGSVPDTGVSNLSLRGDFLFFGDFNGNMYRIYARPQSEGLISAAHVYTLASGGFNHAGKVIFMKTPISAGVNMIGNISGDSITTIINGGDGVFAFSSTPTLVVDKGSVRELDPDGEILWSVDTTTQLVMTPPAPLYPIAVPDSPHIDTPTRVSIKAPGGLSLLHTSSAAADSGTYVLADTGNNRVVQFDRGGRVSWEVSRFTDPNGKLTPGDPDTLNEPSCVQAWSEDPASGSAVKNHYLIADTGNFRILEITDVFDVNGEHLPGNSPTLVWMTNTNGPGNAGGRQYRYTALVAPIDWGTTAHPVGLAPDGRKYIYATVTNKRIAPMNASGQLVAASSDSPGASIVALDYDTSGIAKVMTDLVDAGSSTSLVKLESPRFLELGPGSINAWPNLLIADGHTVTEAYNTGGGFFYQKGFAYDETKYQTQLLPFKTGGPAFDRGALKISFMPGSIQRVGTDIVGGASYGRYLISNTYSQGEAAAPAAKFGGEVFEVYYKDSINGYQIAGLHTLGQPGNGAALSQPSFAFRVP